MKFLFITEENCALARIHLLICGLLAQGHSVVKVTAEKIGIIPRIVRKVVPLYSIASIEDFRSDIDWVLCGLTHDRMVPMADKLVDFLNCVFRSDRRVILILSGRSFRS